MRVVGFGLVVGVVSEDVVSVRSGGLEAWLSDIDVFEVEL